MITRDDYSNGKATHRQYYGDIVQSLPRLALPASIDLIRKALAEGDEHLNTVPLKFWDEYGRFQADIIGREVCKRTTGGYSLSDLVCVLKESARQQAE